MNNNETEREISIPVWLLNIKEGARFIKLLSTDMLGFDTGKDIFPVEERQIKVKVPAYGSMVLKNEDAYEYEHFV